MTAIDLDEDRLNLEIRKFLKQVGVTSQREIEKAMRSAAESGKLSDATAVDAKMTLNIPALGLEHVVEHKFSVG